MTPLSRGIISSGNLDAGGATTTLYNTVGLDGVTQKIEYADAASLDVTTQVSLSAWVYPTAYNVVNTFLSKYSTSGNNRSYYISLFTDGAPFFVISDDGIGVTALYSTTPLALNNWYHIVGSYDGTDYKIYINGVLDATLNSPGITIHNSTVGVLTGGQQIFKNPFTGSVATQMINNVGLTAPQVTEMYNAGNAKQLSSLSAGITSSMVLGVPCNAKIVSPFDDVSSYAHTPVLTGAPTTDGQQLLFED